MGKAGRAVQSTVERLASFETAIRDMGPEVLPLHVISGAILKRVLQAAKEQLRGNDRGALSVEVPFRVDTPLEVIELCRRLFRRVFPDRRKFDVGFTFDRKEDLASQNPFVLAPDVWERMQKRLLETEPFFNSKNSELPMGWIYRFHLRAGERGLQVPGNGHTVEQFLKGPKFAALLRDKPSKISGAEPFSILVEGKYMSGTQLDQTYGGEPLKREAVRHLDARSGEGLDLDLLQRIFTGDFDLAPIEGRPAHEALVELQALMADPGIRLVVTSDPKRALLETAACYGPSSLFGYFGVSRVEGKKAKAEGVSLMCARDNRNGGSHLVPVKHVLILKKAAGA